jgi:hypothetical protein
LSLSDKQIQRQDFVDNLTFDLINNLSPQASDIKWDIELIGEIRDSIGIALVDELKLMTEMEFYPYIVDDFHD